MSFACFIANWKHALRREWPFIINCIIIDYSYYITRDIILLGLVIPSDVWISQIWPGAEQVSRLRDLFTERAVCGAVECTVVGLL